jgi:acyl-lipid omega-6 desaturase (Delta-12 desaturase)
LTESAQVWAKRLAPFRQGNDRRSWTELFLTLTAFFACWVAAYHFYFISLWLMAPAVLLGAGFVVRVFMLQHDCGHNSLFQSRKLNDWVGRCLAIITLTPYDFWRHSHAMHHAGSGNLDRRGLGDITTLTVEEYRALSPVGRIQYRLYRNPFVLFVIGPIYIFMVQQRLPFDAFRQGRPSWIGVLATDVALAVIGGLLIYKLGLWMFLAVHFPIVFFGAAAGVWLFYVQHQFDETHWKRNGDWNHDEAALHGSSYYDLPQPFKWFSGNIGIHHLHHLSSRIPFYRLPEVLKTYPELEDVGRLTFWESLKCVKLALWDEASQKLVSFREAKLPQPQTQMMPAE